MASSCVMELPAAISACRSWSMDISSVSDSGLPSLARLSFRLKAVTNPMFFKDWMICKGVFKFDGDGFHLLPYFEQKCKIPHNKTQKCAFNRLLLLQVWFQQQQAPTGAGSSRQRWFTISGWGFTVTKEFWKSLAAKNWILVFQGAVGKNLDCIQWPFQSPSETKSKSAPLKNFKC